MELLLRKFHIAVACVRKWRVTPAVLVHGCETSKLWLVDVMNVLEMP